MHKGFKCLDVTEGHVYISHDVVFDESVYPFSKLHPNAGVRLRSEILLLHPTLLNPSDLGHNTTTDLSGNGSLHTNPLLEHAGFGDNTASAGTVSANPRRHFMQVGDFPVLAETGADPGGDLPAATASPTLGSVLDPAPSSSAPVSPVSNSLPSTPRAPRGVSPVRPAPRTGGQGTTPSSSVPALGSSVPAVAHTSTSRAGAGSPAPTASGPPGSFAPFIPVPSPTSPASTSPQQPQQQHPTTRLQQGIRKPKVYIDGIQSVMVS